MERQRLRTPIQLHLRNAVSFLQSCLSCYLNGDGAVVFACHNDVGFMSVVNLAVDIATYVIFVAVMNVVICRYRMPT